MPIFLRQQNNVSRRLLCFAAAGLAAAGPAAGNSEVKFLKAADLPALNLSLKIMADSKEAPLPPPTMYTYRIVSNGMESVSVQEMFLPADLWRHRQAAGRWIDAQGNTLTLAVMARPLASGAGPTPHVTRERYEQWLAQAGEPPPWTEPDMARWVADFIGREAVSAAPATNPPPRLAGLIEYTSHGVAAEEIALAFRLNPHAPGQWGAPTSWFCAILQPASGTDFEQARAAMKDDFVKALTVSRNARPAPAALPGGASARQAGAPASRSPEFLASRRQVADSIRNMKDWWFVETENYIILSNMKSRHTSLLKHLSDNIELLRAGFEQFIPARADIAAVSVIRMFASPGEYLRYVGEDHAWTAGLWMPDKQELAIRPSDGGGASESGRVLGTVYHELFHQYIFYALGRLPAAPWFNEGHAELFENSELSARRFDVLENADHQRLVAERLKNKALDLDRLIHMSYQEFYGGGEEARRARYAEAWALVYFLRKAELPNKPFPYAEINTAYGEALVRLKDPDQATRQAFAGVDLARLQADFAVFWQSPRQREQARRNRIFKAFDPE